MLGVGCETEHPFESLLRSVGFDDILDNLAAHWTYSSSPSLPLLQSTLVAEAHMAAPRKEIILNISTYQHYVVTEMCHESDMDLSANLWRFRRHRLTSILEKISFATFPKSSMEIKDWVPCAINDVFHMCPTYVYSTQSTVAS